MELRQGGEMKHERQAQTEQRAAAPTSAATPPQSGETPEPSRLLPAREQYYRPTQARALRQGAERHARLSRRVIETAALVAVALFGVLGLFAILHGALSGRLQLPAGAEWGFGAVLLGLACLGVLIYRLFGWRAPRERQEAEQLEREHQARYGVDAEPEETA